VLRWVSLEMKPSSCSSEAGSLEILLKVWACCLERCWRADSRRRDAYRSYWRGWWGLALKSWTKLLLSLLEWCQTVMKVEGVLSAGLVYIWLKKMQQVELLWWEIKTWQPLPNWNWQEHVRNRQDWKWIKTITKTKEKPPLNPVKNKLTYNNNHGEEETD